MSGAKPAGGAESEHRPDDSRVTAERKGREEEVAQSALAQVPPATEITMVGSARVVRAIGAGFVIAGAVAALLAGISALMAKHGAGELFDPEVAEYLGLAGAGGLVVGGIVGGIGHKWARAEEAEYKTYAIEHWPRIMARANRKTASGELRQALFAVDHQLQQLPVKVPIPRPSEPLEAPTLVVALKTLGEADQHEANRSHVEVCIAHVNPVLLPGLILLAKEAGLKPEQPNLKQQLIDKHGPNIETYPPAAHELAELLIICEWAIEIRYGAQRPSKAEQKGREEQIAQQPAAGQPAPAAGRGARGVRAAGGALVFAGGVAALLAGISALLSVHGGGRLFDPEVAEYLGLAGAGAAIAGGSVAGAAHKRIRAHEARHAEVLRAARDQAANETTRREIREAVEFVNRELSTMPVKVQVARPLSLLSVLKGLAEAQKSEQNGPRLQACVDRLKPVLLPTTILLAGQAGLDLEAANLKQQLITRFGENTQSYQPPVAELAELLTIFEGVVQIHFKQKPA